MPPRKLKPRPRNPQVTSRMMAAVRNKDSKAELLLRRLLHARGLRYRLHSRKLVGRPDLVFPKHRVAVFVDGDFWHGNAWRIRGLACLEDQFPTNREFWVKKIRRNMERDREVTGALAGQGWTVVRLWESDILQAPEVAADKVQEELERPSNDAAVGVR